MQEYIQNTIVPTTLQTIAFRSGVVKYQLILCLVLFPLTGVLSAVSFILAQLTIGILLAVVCAGLLAVTVFYAKQLCKTPKKRLAVDEDAIYLYITRNEVIRIDKKDIENIQHAKANKLLGAIFYKNDGSFIVTTKQNEKYTVLFIRNSSIVFGKIKEIFEGFL